MRKAKTYMDRLMEDKEFRKGFDKEYQNLCIGEQIARVQAKAVNEGIPYQTLITSVAPS
ncbi:MAG: hypothetical protein L6416_10690 [Candidatus Omnitrophica bacterium]|nr:hypothetical protein [Candidatus Omnitrophota bacterium]